MRTHKMQNELLGNRFCWDCKKGFQAWAECLGGVSPPSPKGRAERERLETESFLQKKEEIKYENAT